MSFWAHALAAQQHNTLTGHGVHACDLGWYCKADGCDAHGGLPCR